MPGYLAMLACFPVKAGVQGQEAHHPWFRAPAFAGEQVGHGGSKGA
jgi:hypothetical protein